MMMKSHTSKKRQQADRQTQMAFGDFVCSADAHQMFGGVFVVWITLPASQPTCDEQKHPLCILLVGYIDDGYDAEYYDREYSVLVSDLVICTTVMFVVTAFSLRLSL